MEREPVISKDIASIGYDSSSAILEIEFNSGGVYDYFDVPQFIHDELMAAESKGKYFHANIKNSYSTSRV